MSKHFYLINPILLALGLCLSSCADTSSTPTEPYVDTLITLMQRSQPVLDMSTMPAHFYCQTHHWPTLQDIYTDPENRKALALIADLKTEELQPSGFAMRFHLKKQMQSKVAPFINMKIPNSPTTTECSTGEFVRSKVQISIDTPETDANSKS